MTISAVYDLPAPAKINRFLHVIGRREDGYHLLQSVFQLVDWCDRLHLEVRRDGILSRTDLGEVLPADDLCLRAARALKSACAVDLGAEIAIEKRLPWGAGLGGGSSDAATTLIALNRLWRTGLSRAELQRLALKLGADVPFFVGGMNAFVEGIGEISTPLDLADEWIAIVKPPAAISTPEVFGSKDLVRDTPAVILSGFLAEVQQQLQPQSQSPWRIDIGGFGRNDLQPVAESLEPDVRKAADWLHARFGNARMTGSGSAVFARAGTDERPSAAFPQEELPAGWVGRMCRGLDRHPLADWSG